MQLIIYISTLVISVSCICSNITIGIDSYDLSYFSKLQPSNNLTFNLCAPADCTRSGYKYQTLIQDSSFVDQICSPLTPSTNPTTSAYTVENNVLAINFPSIRLFGGNQTSVNTSVTTKLLVTCSTNNALTMKSNIVSGDSTTRNYTLHIQSQAGCSFSIPNYFWQFLIDRKLVFALILIAIGLFEMFFGYFLIQITIFLFGWVAGSAFSLIYLAESYPNSDPSPTSVINFMIILSCLLGIFYGFLLITLPKLGYFNIGVWLGVIFTMMLQNAVLYLSKSLLAFYIVLGILCCSMGIIAVLAFKYFIIVSTSIISGFMLVRPLGFYLDYYPNEFEFYKSTGSMPWQYYLYLISSLVFAALGIIFQTWLFHKLGKRKNNLYHLEEQGDFKERIKKLLEFKDIKAMIESGKEEFTFLKTLVRKDSRELDRQSSVRQISQYTPEKNNRNNKRNPNVNNFISEPQKARSSSEDEESVEIELVEMKGKGRQTSKNKSKKSINSCDSDKDKNQKKKGSTKIVGYKKQRD